LGGVNVEVESQKVALLPLPNEGRRTKDEMRLFDALLCSPNEDFGRRNKR
jgi:hypothetical protein